MHCKFLRLLGVIILPFGLLASASIQHTGTKGRCLRGRSYGATTDCSTAFVTHKRPVSPQELISSYDQRSGQVVKEGPHHSLPKVKRDKKAPRRIYRRTDDEAEPKSITRKEGTTSADDRQEPSRSDSATSGAVLGEKRRPGLVASPFPSLAKRPALYRSSSFFTPAALPFPHPRPLPPELIAHDTPHPRPGGASPLSPPSRPPPVEEHRPSRTPEEEARPRSRSPSPEAQKPRERDPLDSAKRGYFRATTELRLRMGVPLGTYVPPPSRYRRGASSAQSHRNAQSSTQAGSRETTGSSDPQGPPTGTRSLTEDQSRDTGTSRMTKPHHSMV